MGAVQTFLLETADAVVRSFDLAEPWKLDDGRPPKVHYPPPPRVLSSPPPQSTLVAFDRCLDVCRPSLAWEAWWLLCSLRP